MATAQHSISELSSAQKRFSKMTPLSKCLGDGFLYYHNPIYRSLRNHTLKIGVTFSSNVHKYYYDTCHHLALKMMLEDKVIPYFQNAGPLSEMQSRMSLLDASKMVEIKKNRILHESAHLLAQSLFKGTLGTDVQGFVLITLLSESYASACEVMGYYFLDNEIHDWMYRQNTNTFGCEGKDYRDKLSEVIKKYGLVFCFKFSILSFLHWNFFYLSMNLNDVKRVLSLCGNIQCFSHKDLRLLLQFSSFHFRVRNWFRKEVAGYYFKSHGIQGPLTEILKFDFVSILGTNHGWSDFLIKLGHTIEG